jgi:hypothetical protein
VDIKGLYPNDTWSGSVVTYSRRRCKPGRLTVNLSSDDQLFFEPQNVVARSNGSVVGRVRLHGNAHVLLNVPIEPMPGTTDCRVLYTVSPTAVPGAGDDRVLGAHFNRFVYRPAQ